MHWKINSNKYPVHHSISLVFAFPSINISDTVVNDKCLFFSKLMISGKATAVCFAESDAWNKMMSPFLA